MENQFRATRKGAKGLRGSLGEPPQGYGGTAGPAEADRSLFLTVRTPRQAWLGKKELLSMSRTKIAITNQGDKLTD